MWLRTVSRLSCSSAAICVVDRPSSSRRSTSSCRGVRCSSGCDCGSSRTSDPWPNTPTTCSPCRSGTELISTASRLPPASTTTTCASVTSVFPRILRAKSSRALVADQPLSGTVHPPDEARAIDHVTRHAHVAERRLQICSHRPERFDGHEVRLRPRRLEGQSARRRPPDAAESAVVERGGIDEARDATRRTRLASERTYLAWWRTGLTAFAVAFGAGRVVPELTGGTAG